MASSPNTIKQKLDDVTEGWRTLRPDKSFAGMTLQQFAKAIQPSYDAREQLASVDKQREALVNQRDDADVKSMELVQLVVNSVKGEPDEGEDGDLYDAMGYVRRSERQSGLHRGTNHASPAAH